MTRQRDGRHRSGAMCSNVGVTDAPLAPNGKPLESVWDYPRPPRLERVASRVVVAHRGVTIVDAPEAVRVLETSQPPAYYVSPEHIDLSRLAVNEHHTFCEWKGTATYADVVVDGVTVERAAWSYPTPTDDFTSITGWWAFYAQLLDECSVDGERVTPNEGSFYGGWITSNVTGPFKGAPGTSSW